jgi:ribonuclease HII
LIIVAKSLLQQPSKRVETQEIPIFADPEAIVIGVDEVGRGALFGPVVAAAVAIAVKDLPLLQEIGVKDSKKLSPTKRSRLVGEIDRIVLCQRIGYATVAEIDRLNILQASLLAMKRAILKLKIEPTICSIDGNHIIPDLTFPQQAIVKGDEKSPAIAAASIIAKVWRDSLIIRWDDRYPEYKLGNHKGYGTLQHRREIVACGLSPQHRRSFTLKDVEK